MKSIFALTILLPFSTIFSFGQDSGFLTGYIVTKLNDTIPGYVKYINQVPYRILPEIKFKETEDGKAKEYKPSELISYRAADKTFHSMRTPGDVYGGQSFMELVIDGTLKLYKFRVSTMGVPQSGYTPYDRATSSNYYLLKGEVKTLFSIEKGKFKETVSEYLNDVKEVSDKIKSGDLQKRDIEIIVKEYNRLLGQ